MTQIYTYIHILSVCKCGHIWSCNRFLVRDQSGNCPRLPQVYLADSTANRRRRISHNCPPFRKVVYSTPWPAPPPLATLCAYKSENLAHFQTPAESWEPLHSTSLCLHTATHEPKTDTIWLGFWARTSFISRVLCTSLARVSFPLFFCSIFGPSEVLGVVVRFWLSKYWPKAWAISTGI